MASFGTLLHNPHWQGKVTRTREVVESIQAI